MVSLWGSSWMSACSQDLKLNSNVCFAALPSCELAGQTQSSFNEFITSFVWPFISDVNPDNVLNSELAQRHLPTDSVPHRVPHVFVLYGLVPFLFAHLQFSSCSLSVSGAVGSFFRPLRARHECKYDANDVLWADTGTGAEQHLLTVQVCRHLYHKHLQVQQLSFCRSLQLFLHECVSECCQHVNLLMWLWSVKVSGGVRSFSQAQTHRAVRGFCGCFCRNESWELTTSLLSHVRLWSTSLTWDCGQCAAFLWTTLWSCHRTGSTRGFLSRKQVIMLQQQEGQSVL